MSGALPTSPAFANLQVSSHQPTLVTRAISGRRQVRQIAGHRWEMRAKYPPMTRAEFAPIYAFLIKQRGEFESFTVTPPTISTGQGNLGGTPLVNGASQTGRSVATDGWTAGVLVLKAGDFIKFAGHSKIYMMTVDETSADPATTATLTIEPALLESPANNEAITHTNIPFTMALSGEVQEFALGTSGLFVYELDMEEAF